MKNKWILIAIFILLIIPILHFSPIYQSDTEAGQEYQECEVFIVTETGDHKRGDLSCYGYAPTIEASDETIDSGATIELYAHSGCTPYTWTVSTVSGTSEYTLDETITYSDTEIVTLTAASGSCTDGTYDDDNIVVTVTVKDNRDCTSKKEIRNNEGGWGDPILSETCGEVSVMSGHCNCTDCSTCILGAYKYQDCWFGGTVSSRYTSYGCTKWECTYDIKLYEKCSCPGFEPKFNYFGLISKKKWEWKCQ